MAEIDDQRAKDRIDKLLAQLDSPDDLQCKKARLSLIEAGQEAVPVLIEALSSPNVHTRWEAAEALCEMNTPAAAPVLVKLLDDEDSSVRWAAVKAISNLGGQAIPALLQALVEHFQSIHLREGAHHVLREMNRKHALSVPVFKVYQALGELEPEMTVPWLAERALEEMGYYK
jgi:HEAT repeat protein